jgi:prefoldin subunit 5
MSGESAATLKKQINNLEKELQAVKDELSEAQKGQESLRFH